MGKNQLSDFRSILAKYIHLSCIKISIFLKDGSKIRLKNAVMKKDYIVNNFYENFDGTNIPLKSIEFAEFHTD